MQILRLEMQVPQQVPRNFREQNLKPLLAEGIPDRNVLNSEVFASCAESFANFAGIETLISAASRNHKSLTAKFAKDSAKDAKDAKVHGLKSG